MPISFRYHGFTLIELLVVVVLIGILTTLAMPTYQQYIKRARFAEVIIATSPFKTAVMLAIQQGIVLSDITNGKYGIPLSPLPTKHLAEIQVKNAVITAIGTALVDKATYILKPTSEGNHWSITGSCLKNELCSA